MKGKKVVLYSTMTCPYCKMEAAWLEENNVDYKEVHVDLNQSAAREMVEKTGQMGVPVTEIVSEGEQPEFIVGFNRPLLQSKLLS